MEVKIYGGDKIGGCVTEIKHKNTSIIIDYGKNLDDTPQVEIEGLTKCEITYDAVFVSHYHIDHIGNIDKIINNSKNGKKIKIFVEKTTKKLYDIMCDFQTKPCLDVELFEFEEEKIVGDLIVTAYKVDHSAYNSAMFLIESLDRKERVLYTGDFRDNGYTGDSLIPTLEKIGKVDQLIIEGTNLGDNSHIIKKEEKLVEEFKEVMDKYDKIFVLMSASNIDRINTMYMACQDEKHTLIQDIYMAHLTSTIYKEDNVDIPNPISKEDIMVYKPKYFFGEGKTDEFKEKYILKSFNDKNNSLMLYKPFVMDIRTSMLRDLRIFKRIDDDPKRKKKILDKACIVYSMWGGYKEQKEDMKNFLAKVKELGIPLVKKTLHTTGHASPELIEKVIEIVGSPKTYIIHTSGNKENAIKENG